METLEAAIGQGLVVSWFASHEPDRAAVISSSGDRTYAELDENATRLTRVLRAAGLQAGDAVALLCGNRPEFVEVLAACDRGGFRLTPVNWHLTGAEASYIVEDCGAKAVVIEAGLDAMAVALPEGPLRLIVGAKPGDVDPATSSVSYADALAAADPSPLEDPVRGTVMLYTSGTTGRPKGVHRPPTPAAQAVVEAKFSGYAPGMVHLCTGPLYHAAPLALSLAVVLYGGATVVLMDRWDERECLELVQQHRVTHTHMVPTMFHRLLSLPDDVREQHDTTSLLAVIHGAAPCPVPVKQRLIEWLGPIVWEYYAATEGAGTIVDSHTWLTKPGTVGKPAPEGQVIVGDDDANPLPANTVGQVWLRAPALGRFEYYGDEEKTESTFRGDYFTLGDLGYLDEDGFLFLTDRSANLIISGGVNIYPAEVDAVLLEHDSVGDAATIGVPNDEWGEEVLAVVELQHGAVATDALAARAHRVLSRSTRPLQVPASGGVHRRVASPGQRQDLQAAAAGPLSRGGRTHQLGEVARVEALLRGAVHVTHRRLEARERIAATFGVWVVGREEEELLACVLDHPADGLGRERRELQLAPHVLARPQRKVQRRFGAREHLLREVEPPHPRHHPHRSQLDAAAAQSGELLEDAVEHHDREERLRRVVQDHVVLRADVLATTEKVGRAGLAVVVVLRVEAAATAADVQHERHAGFLQATPDAVELRMRGRLPGRGYRWHLDRGAAQLERGVELLLRERDVGEREEADRQQARVGRAEVRHGAVERAGPAVEELEVLATELRRGERREHELLLEAEEIERATALARVHRTERVPTLRAHQRALELRGRVGVAASSLGVGERLLGERTRTAEGQRADAITNTGIGVALEPVRRLHQMAVGVEAHATRCVRHPHHPRCAIGPGYGVHRPARVARRVPEYFARMAVGGDELASGFGPGASPAKSERNVPLLVARAGAALVIIGTFLPWARVTIGTYSSDVFVATPARVDGWITFWCGVVALVALFMARPRRREAIAIAAGGIAAGTSLSYFLNLFGRTTTQFRARDVTITTHSVSSFGLWLTVAGSLALVAGAVIHLVHENDV